jgi:hypothetical protein
MNASACISLTRKQVPIVGTIAVFCRIHAKKATLHYKEAMSNEEIFFGRNIRNSCSRDLRRSDACARQG